MLPFCGYHMGDYFQHWLDLGKKLKKAPKIFLVNWFRKNPQGKYIWPGYTENMRVLKWITERVHGQAQGASTPLGIVPRPQDINLEGIMGFDLLHFDELMDINKDEWNAEIKGHEELFAKLSARLPKEFVPMMKSLAAKIDSTLKSA